MKRITRRDFVKDSMTAGLVLGMPRIVMGQSSSNGVAPNETVRVAVIGLGDTTAVGGVGGRGHQLIARLREMPGVKITALCDVDQKHLDREVKSFKDRGQAVATFTDIRKVLEDKSVDAVIVALPNHWHALATVWACQAGKDVYVEKPFSYNLWEGKQMVAAARKYGRMVQVGTQNRSSTSLPRTFESLRSGEIGPIRFGHTVVYRARTGIGKVTAPTPVPATVDYDLWCGPAPKGPLMRKQLHYEWHWFWETGNGEIGNNGVHVMDLCRWALGQNQPPPHAMSIGGRFGFDDCGETANTQIALLDYQPAPMICEIRNVSVAKDSMGKFRNRSGGLVIDCEGGYFAGDASGGAIFDKEGKKIKDLPDDGSSNKLEVLHLSHFMTAVRSRKSNALAADAVQGHLSAVCCHLPNISHRLGKEASPDTIKEKIGGNAVLSDAFERCREYLRENGVDLNRTPAVLGPWLTFDPKQERFTGAFATEANALSQREYRKGFEVPKLA
jgi:predicted dehydrogenase